MLKSAVVEKEDKTDDLIIIGKINGFFGVKGWVKVFSYTQPKENIINYRKILIKEKLERGFSWQPYEISQGRVQGKTIVVHISGYDNKDDVQKFFGQEIAINKEDLPQLGNKDYYWRDLIGLNVNDIEGNYLGIVDSMMATGSNDVMVVKPQDEGNKTDSILIPFVLDLYIKEVNLTLGTMIVDWDQDF
ncbi:MAG: ribosome maturation factor RimM [Gammaproteobacteria bacterium]|nr:ribosome maturation factor RimM [Gammaproteobacteria bacterium]